MVETLITFVMEHLEHGFFLLFASAAIVCAVLVVTLKNPVHCALFLMACFLQVAALFILLRVPFLAAIQVFIYVGAVMVLFVFAVLLLDMEKVLTDTAPKQNSKRNKDVAIFTLVLIAIEMVFIFASSVFSDVSKLKDVEVTIEPLAKFLFTRFLFPFEVVSIILLVAIVAAIVMAKDDSGDGKKQGGTN